MSVAARQGQSTPANAAFRAKRVAVVPCPALGDVTLYLHLAWIFHRSGAQVSFHSGLLVSAQAYFPWIELKDDAGLSLSQLAATHDLVVSYVNWLHRTGEVVDDVLQAPNVAYVTAKKLPRSLALDGRAVTVAGMSFAGACRPLCLQSRTGWSMVQWVDHYAREVFGLSCDEPVQVRLPTAGQATRPCVSIFPTTPEPSKNYSLHGFVRLARRLERLGWRVEFVCMPAEQAQIEAAARPFPVRSFDSIKHLMDHLSGCEVVISNDSGGGHLGSLMGLRTFTITRKRPDFVWRPGFNPHNQVIAPLLTFKVRGRHVWRPFVPLWRIPSALASRASR